MLPGLVYARLDAPRARYRKNFSFVFRTLAKKEVGVASPRFVISKRGSLFSNFTSRTYTYLRVIGRTLYVLLDTVKHECEEVARKGFTRVRVIRVYFTRSTRGIAKRVGINGRAGSS